MERNFEDAAGKKLNCQLIQRAKMELPSDLANKVLYGLCSEYPEHNRDDEIIAKILLIGRAYAAAIERRKNESKSEKDGDDFYLKVVAPKMKKARIDSWFASISGEIIPTIKNQRKILRVHKKMTILFSDISGLNKRSLASKYLHFHFPNLFYLFDKRSSSAISRLTPGIKDLPSNLRKCDEDYAKFFLRCMGLVSRVNRECQIELTPRELDKFLLASAKKR